jgi:hypothetical protein
MVAGEFEILKSTTAALRAEVEEMKRERLMERLAASLYLGYLRGAITDKEAVRLARRGMQDDLREAPAVVRIVRRLEDERWVTDREPCV